MCESYNFSVVREDQKCKIVSLSEQKQVEKCGYCDREFPKNLQFNGHENQLKSRGYLSLGSHPSSEPFEIYAQGLGLFFTRKNSWLGFNEHAKGFGGEECYIHEKYRQNGRKTMCLPFLKWLHRFDRAEGVPYPLTIDNKVRNYILEFTELGLDFTPLKQHFVTESHFEENKWNELIKEANGLYNKNANSKGTVSSEQQLLEEIAALKSKLASVEV
jgi:hypothetical protein